MSTPAERVDSLDPPPSAIVSFIQAVAGNPWPAEANQSLNYFERLGCELQPATDADAETPLGVTRGAFVSRRLTTGNASWLALDGVPFSLNFFVYENAPDVAAAVNAGYNGVRAGLIALHGPPLDERTDPHENRSAIWHVKDTLIELYAHVTLAPVLQIGLSHNERNAIYERRVAGPEPRGGTPTPPTRAR